MTDEIRPALTPEEWGWALQDGGPNDDYSNELEHDARKWGESLTGGDGWKNRTPRHGLAALCLYQQPFGFTREDAKVLARFADCQITDSIVDGSVADGDFEKLASLAARIIALLPPAHQETPK